MASDDVLPLWISLSFSILIFLVFFFYLTRFLKLQDRNYGFYMILVLCLSDICYPLISLFTIGIGQDNTEEYAYIIGPIAMAINGFNIYWTAVLSIYTYLVIKSTINLSLKSKKGFSYTKFSLAAGGISLLLTSIFPIL